MVRKGRRTADRMAQYKKDAAKSVQGAQPFRSEPPSRCKKSRTIGDSENARSTGSEEGRSSVRISPAKGASKSVVRQRKSPRLSPRKTKDAVNRGKKVALMELTEVPDTPTCASLSSGRKRINAPDRRNGVSYDVPASHGSGAAISFGDDCEMPSKKRKTFQTPPPGVSNSRVAGQCRRKLFDAGGAVDGRRIMPRSLPVLDANFEGDIADELEPPLPTVERHSIFNNENPGYTTSKSVRPDEFSARGNRNLSVPSQLLPSDDFDAITTSTAILQRMFQVLQGNLCSDLERVRHECISEVGKMSSALATKFTSEFRNVVAMIDLMYKSGSKGSKSGKGVKKTPLSEWEDKLDELTPALDVIFNTEVFARIICFNAPKTVVGIYNSGISADIKNACDAVQALLFSLQPGSKKHEYSDGIGKLHGEFKFVVVQNAFFNVTRDVFGFFLQPVADTEGESSLMLIDVPGSGRTPCAHQGRTDIAMDVHEDNTRIERPPWLRRGFVAVDHIRWARSFLENINQSRKNKIRSTPTPSDIACHAALRVYRELGTHVHDARELVRMKFFTSLGYLLVPWSRHVSDNDQKNLRLSFPEVQEELEFTLILGEIPLTTTCSSTADAQTKDAADVRNKELLNGLFADWDAMILTASHDVHVVQHNGVQRRHKGGDMRTIQRLINVIDVALDVCVEYSRIGSREVFLRTNEYALRCVMIFALVLKALTVDFIVKTVQSRSENKDPPDPRNVIVHATSLYEMVPGDNCQANLLRSRCLRMNEKEFNLLNYNPDREAVDNNEDRTSEIQESAELGIAIV